MARRQPEFKEGSQQAYRCTLISNPANECLIHAACSEAELGKVSPGLNAVSISFSFSALKPASLAFLLRCSSSDSFELALRCV